MVRFPGIGNHKHARSLMGRAKTKGFLVESRRRRREVHGTRRSLDWPVFPALSRPVELAVESGLKVISVSPSLILSTDRETMW